MSALLNTSELSRPNISPSVSRRTRQAARGRCWQCMTMVPALAIVWATSIGTVLPAGQAALPAGQLALLVTVFVAAITDLHHRKIYNWTTYPTVLWSLVFASIVSFGPMLGFETQTLGTVTIMQSLVGMLMCGAFTFVAYLFSGGGAGDVKLSICIGGWLGVESGLWTVGLGYILAAIAIVVLSSVDPERRGTLSALIRKIASHFFPTLVLASTAQNRELQRTIPLGGFFAVATCCVLVWGSS